MSDGESLAFGNVVCLTGTAMSRTITRCPGNSLLSNIVRCSVSDPSAACTKGCALGPTKARGGEAGGGRTPWPPAALGVHEVANPQPATTATTANAATVARNPKRAQQDATILHSANAMKGL
jgi:hypothetical protein